MIKIALIVACCVASAITSETPLNHLFFEHVCDGNKLLNQTFYREFICAQSEQLIDEDCFEKVFEVPLRNATRHGYVDGWLSFICAERVKYLTDYHLFCGCDERKRKIQVRIK